MAKKKTVKRVSRTSTRGYDNNTFLLIVGGGFVIVVLVFLLLGNARRNDTEMMPTPTPVATTDTNGNENITVTSPETDEVIERPVTITGKARVFENVVSYRVKDSDGFVLVSGSTTYESEDTGEFGEFTITTNYLEPKGETGTVEVYNASAKDGTDENVVSVPVMFK